MWLAVADGDGDTPSGREERNGEDGILQDLANREAGLVRTDIDSGGSEVASHVGPASRCRCVAVPVHDLVFTGLHDGRWVRTIERVLVSCNLVWQRFKPSLMREAVHVRSGICASVALRECRLKDRTDVVRLAVVVPAHDFDERREDV